MTYLHILRISIRLQMIVEFHLRKIEWKVWFYPDSAFLEGWIDYLRLKRSLFHVLCLFLEMRLFDSYSDNNFENRFENHFEARIGNRIENCFD